VKPKTKIIVREIQLEASTILKYIHDNPKVTYIDSVTNNPFPFISPLGWHSYLLVKK
jgi:hypothetical protein